MLRIVAFQRKINSGAKINVIRLFFSGKLRAFQRLKQRAAWVFSHGSVKETAIEAFCVCF